MRRTKVDAKKVRSRDRAAEKRRDEHAAFFARPAFPVVVLSVDPGTRAGAAVIAPGTDGRPKVVLCEAIDSATRALEAMISSAIAIARAKDMMLLLAIEEWGRGGPLGIDQWIGLGERRGLWKREFLLLGSEAPAPSPIRKSESIVHVNARTWRSRMIFETGERVADTFRPFDTDGWKRAATRTLLAHAPDVAIETADAAEAALLGLYSIRSDELHKRLGKRYLASRGFV